MASTSHPRSSTPATSRSARRNCYLRVAFPRTEEPTMNRPSQPTHVQEKAPKPQGLLPKNIQSWLLIGLAFLMVAIMWLTGGKKPQTPAKAASSAATVQAPLEVNETKIAEMQNRIQDLQRQQLVAQTALAQQTRQLGAVAHDSPQSQQPGAGGTGEQRPEVDPIQAERKRRAYVSLFSSNVALSYRKPPANAPAAATETPLALPAPLPSNPDASQIAQLLKDMQPNSVSPVPPRNDSAETPKDRKEEAKNPAAVSAGSANAAAGKTYVLLEGTILETVLINRLDGGFAGPVECLLLPDVYSVSLDQFKGLNQVGDTGLRDQVNSHYLRIFGVSLAVGALGAVAEADTAGSLVASGTDRMRQGFAQSTAQSSAQILDKF